MKQEMPKIPNLGEVVSIFKEIDEEEVDLHWKAKEHKAPEECFPFIVESCNDLRKRFWDELRNRGITKDLLANELKGRVSHKWIHDNGLNYLLEV